MLGFASYGKDKISVDLFLFLNFLFSFFMFLLFESRIVKFTLFFINLYFFGKKFTRELKKISFFF